MFASTGILKKYTFSHCRLQMRYKKRKRKILPRYNFPPGASNIPQQSISSIRASAHRLTVMKHSVCSAACRQHNFPRRYECTQ